jgi:hypothetical protein
VRDAHGRRCGAPAAHSPEGEGAGIVSRRAVPIEVPCGRTASEVSNSPFCKCLPIRIFQALYQIGKVQSSGEIGPI